MKSPLSQLAGQFRQIIVNKPAADLYQVACTHEMRFGVEVHASGPDADEVVRRLAKFMAEKGTQ